VLTQFIVGGYFTITLINCQTTTTTVSNSNPAPKTTTQLFSGIKKMPNQ